MMQRRGLNSRELAKKLKITDSRVSQIFSNANSLTLTSLITIADVLRCDLNITLQRRDKKKMNQSTDSTLQELKDLFRLNGIFRIDDMVDASWATQDKVTYSNLRSKYLSYGGMLAAWLHEALEQNHSFDDFMSQMDKLKVLDEPWPSIISTYISGQKITALALMHHPEKTEDEAKQMEELKARYWPNKTNNEIIQAVKEDMTMHGGAPALFAKPELQKIASSDAIDRWDAREIQRARMIDGNIYKDGKGLWDDKQPPVMGSYTKALKNCLIADQPLDNNNPLKLTVTWPHQKESISFVAYKSVEGEQTFYAYGRVREANLENGTFVFVASIFNSDGQAINEIAIPKTNIINPIQEVELKGGD